jgi:hypothetical protein
LNHDGTTKLGIHEARIARILNHDGTTKLGIH